MLGLDLVQAMLITELPDIGNGEYDFVHALIHVAYTAPRRAYGLFPTAAVVGADGPRAARREFGTHRAARARPVAAPVEPAVALALAVLTLLMVVNGETLAPMGQRQADAIKAQAKSNAT